MHLILKIISDRLKSIKTIQNRFKAFQYRSKILIILQKEKNNIKFTYPFKANKVKLLLFISPIKKNDVTIIKKFDFEFCKIQEMLILYLNTSLISPGKYKAQIEVDGLRTCDGRYPHFEFLDGLYYNVIDIFSKSSEAKNNKPIYENTYDKELEKLNDNTATAEKKSIMNCSNMSNYSLQHINFVHNKKSSSSENSGDNFGLYLDKSFSSLKAKKNLDLLSSLKNQIPINLMEKIEADFSEDFTT